MRYQSVGCNQQWRIMPLGGSQDGKSPPCTIVLELTQFSLPVQQQGQGQGQGQGQPGRAALPLHLIVLEAYDNAGLAVTK